MGECKVENCLNEVAAKGLCTTHYRRMRLYGDPLKIKQEHIKDMPIFCQAKDCSKKSIAKGLCFAHYKRMRLYGNPNILRQKQKHGLTLEQRFWSYVIKSPGCWLWTGYCDPNGYGRIMMKGQSVLASRLSWNIHHGDIPLNKKGKSKYVLHKCDNPSCVNPQHLYLGDQFDNMTDMWARGRANPGHLVGEHHGMAKLTENQVKEIRMSKETCREAAIKYGITATTVSDIRKYRTWKHL